MSLGVKNKYDYIFGAYQIISWRKIGCSILLSKASIIQHLLYYTDSDTSHINPFIQLSLANKTKFHFLPLHNIKISNLENIDTKFSSNFICPKINDKADPSLCIIIPAFKRNYFLESFPKFSNQTYKPKFYVIIQNDNRKRLNLSAIQNLVKERVYHIWMQNWNSFFFLSHRFSALFPCDFILKYDDDQWPKDNILQEKLIQESKNKNVIIGRGSMTIDKPICGYNPKINIHNKNDIADHVASPLIIRPGYFKLDARNKIFQIFDAEDVHLSLNSKLLCNVTSKRFHMDLIQRQRDGNQHDADKIFMEIRKKIKDIFMNTYCYLIHSGYIPKLWSGFILPKKDYLNITIKHKALN